jgi:hypothetical protein
VIIFRVQRLGCRRPRPFYKLLTGFASKRLDAIRVKVVHPNRNGLASCQERQTQALARYNKGLAGEPGARRAWAGW